MASSEESPQELHESWEYTLLGNKKTGTVGTRDVLILVSRESGDEDIVTRKKGELTQKDKDRLSSEGIPKDCWEDDAKMMKERFSKDRRIKSIKVEENPCYTNRKYALSKITALFNNTTAQGVGLCYIGPGRRGTGDWCFSDGFITFTDIANLYIERFKGRTLYIASDCSYSGQWVEACKEFLDQKGVQPCGHSAKKTGIKLKVRSSCQPDQIGSSLVYSARGHGNDKNTGVWYVWASITVAPDQNSTSRDFTAITCGKSPQEECALIPNYTFQEERKRSRMYTVRGVDRGRPAWHIVLLVDDPETIRLFKEKTKGENSGTQTVSINDYGVSIKSGWGQDPPQEVMDWVARVQEGFEDLPP